MKIRGREINASLAAQVVIIALIVILIVVSYYWPRHATWRTICDNGHYESRGGGGRYSSATLVLVCTASHEACFKGRDGSTQCQAQEDEMPLIDKSAAASLDAHATVCTSRSVACEAHLGSTH